MADNQQLYVPRDLLAKYFADDPRLISHFEDQALAVAQTVEITGGNVSTTERLQDATVVTLSANADLNNEFLLSGGDGTKLAVTAGSVKVNVDETVARATGFTVTLAPPAHVTLGLPAEGTLISDTYPAVLYNKQLVTPLLSGLINAATEAAAAAAGVPVGGMYRDGTTLKIRTV
jgi:hypothetical protein